MPTVGRAALPGLFLVVSLAGCSALHGRCAVEEDPETRAGCPSSVSRCAAPSDTGRYTGYLVGGGAACKGDAPTRDEGTWGWDYCGLCFSKIVNLGWFHGRRCQGGTGSYETDGPHLGCKKDE